MLKDYDQIMDNLNDMIFRNPKALNKELDRVEGELNQLGASQDFTQEVEFWDTPVGKGLRLIEFNSKGQLTMMIGINQAKDFKNGGLKK